MQAARDWLRQRPNQIWLAIFGLYLVGRIILIAGGHIYTSYDAFTYRANPGTVDDGLVSLAGDAPRPWGLPLFYALFGSDGARTVAQWAVGTLAWGWFAWELGSQLVTRLARYGTVGVIALLALTPTVASWDLAILTESLSISLGVAALGLLLHWLRTGRVAALAGLAVVGMWWTFLRPDIRAFTTALIGVLVLVAGRALWRLRTRRYPSRRAAGVRTLACALGAAVVLGSGIGWYAAISPTIEGVNARYDADAIVPPMKQDEHRLVYRLRVEVSLNPRLWDAFTNDLGMPVCPELEEFRRTHTMWDGRQWAYAYKRCAPLVEWVNARKDQIFWTGLAKADPGLFARTFLNELSLSLGGEAYAHVPSVVPKPVERLYFPSRRYGLWTSLSGLVVSLALVLWSGAARGRPGTHAAPRRFASAESRVGHRRLVWFGLLAFGTGVLSSLATIMLVTGELARFGIQEAIAARIGIIALLAAAVDVWLLRRRSGLSSPSAARPGQAPADA